MRCEGCRSRDKEIRDYQKQIIDLTIRLLKTLPREETSDMQSASAQNNPMFETGKET